MLWGWWECGGSPRLTMTVVADTPDGLVVIVGDAVPLRTPRYGAFIEQSGRNQWQPVASARLAKTAQTSEKPLPWVATGCR